MSDVSPMNPPLRPAETRTNTSAATTSAAKAVRCLAMSPSSDEPARTRHAFCSLLTCIEQGATEQHPHDTLTDC